MRECTPALEDPTHLRLLWMVVAVRVLDSHGAEVGERRVQHFHPAAVPARENGSVVFKSWGKRRRIFAQEANASNWVGTLGNDHANDVRGEAECRSEAQGSEIGKDRGARSEWIGSGGMRDALSREG